jgi:purine-binding chemotaxis protein CheW
MMVVVRVGPETVSLLVDHIGEVVTAEPGTFAEPPETLPGALRSLVRGAHCLPDRLLLVLDVDQAVAA